MHNNCTISHARLWLKLFGIILGFIGIYSLLHVINKHSFLLTNINSWMGLLSVVILPAFCLVIWIAAIKIDKGGISQIYGIEFKNGKFYGWKFEYPWKNLEIRVWSTWPNPAIAIDKSKVPKRWALNTHYADCMRMIAKYGKERMMDEETRQYFRKFEEIK
jgi:hypothetical protein